MNVPRTVLRVALALIPSVFLCRAQAQNVMLGAVGEVRGASADVTFPADRTCEPGDFVVFTASLPDVRPRGVVATGVVTAASPGGAEVRFRMSSAGAVLRAGTTVEVLRMSSEPTPRAPAPVQRDGREIFVYRDRVNPGDGVFRFSAAGWVETCPDGVVFKFREVERTKDYIELRDDSREMGIRLHAGRSMWRHPKASMGEWAELYNGHWERVAR